MSQSIDTRFSRNAGMLKVLSILAIAFGHFAAQYPEPLPFLQHWWVISAVGLIVFSYTSALFTAIRYESDFDLRAFWGRKLMRLGVPFTIINLLLLVVFLAEGREGLLSLQTLASWLGLRGFWTWFGIAQVGPYGAGLWFLTVLIMFYIAYPLLDRMNRVSLTSNVFTLVAVGVLLVLDRTVPMGHTLWITVAGFFLGVCDARHGRPLSYSVAAMLLVLTGLAMVSLRFFVGSSVLSGLLMLVAARLLVDVFRYIHIPVFVKDLLLPLSPMVLAIYISHTYLFFFPTHLFLFDLAVSLFFILSFAFVVSLVSRLVLAAGAKRAQPKTVRP